MESNAWESVFPSSFSGSGFNIEALLRANDVSSKVQDHLKRVYLALAATMVAACAGTVFYMYTHLTPFLSCIAMMFLLFGLTFESAQVPPERRLPRLLLFGFFQGASIGSLVEHAFHVSPALVGQAFFLTVMTFGCFAAAATFSERRSLLYLYGMISTGMSWLIFASFFNIFFRSVFLFETEVFLGLALFIGYVCADSQIIIERADLGDMDFVRHALGLFLNFVAIFIRILIILLRSKEREGDSSKRKNRRG